MKIQPIQIWKNGSLKEATSFNCYVVSDNLRDSASFNYSLHSESESPMLGDSVATGQIYMTGDDYQAWQTNEYAWQWAAQKLGLTLIEEEVVPPTEPTEPETQP